ncbi:MAG: hypothetical protein IIT58_08850 [Treponema sp.]|nr:hypothetical protein [Treponema sp.]
MTVTFCNKKLQELYVKGFSDDYIDVPKKVLDDFLVGIEMAGSASNMKDLDFPPFKNLLQDDGTCTLFLYNGWKINLSIEFADEGNNVKVISLTNKNMGV